MSASLVGSEMCIRDRQRELARKPHADITDYCREYLEPALAVTHEEEIAVSYTHLTLPTICSV
eukprot:2315725-Alexandrium_andersonii.AAC.1